MNTKLITALRTAATALEQNMFDYDWSKVERCNCGVVICALKGLSASAFSKFLNRIHGDDDNERLTWTAAVGRYCPITGVPNHVLFRGLNDLGLTPKDIVELENLSNPDVLKVLSRTLTKTETRTTVSGRLFKKRVTHDVTKPVPVRCDDKLHLIAYLRAWAGLLVAQGRMDSAEPAAQRKEPTCP